VSLNSFLHDPTWMKFNGAALLGSSGVLALVALRVKVVLRQKKDIYKPDVLLAEIYAPDDAEEIGTHGSSPTAVKPLSASPRSRVITVMLALICIAVSASAFTFALRNYIILTNWQEGQSRDFIGDHVGAIVCYKKALRLDPSLRHTHLLTGIALLKSNHIRAAISEFKAASNSEDADPQPAAMLGDAYQILNMPAQAVEAYKNAAAISPRDPVPYISIGGCMEKLGRPDIAYSAYLYAVHLNPSYVPAQIKLGALLINTRHPDEGMAHLKSAISLAPRDRLAHSTVATAYAQFKMYDDAIAEYRKAIDIDSKFAVAWFNLGVTLEHMNQWERALDAFNTCTKLTPRNNAEKAAVDLSLIEVRKIEVRLKHG
jgi:tetratricopeptide (TPR) repeat protein